MTITRRFLLRGMAALAGAVAARAVAPPVMAAPVPAPAPAAPSALDALTAELQWAHAELWAALDVDDFGQWVVDSDEERPHRFRLARALVLSRDLDLSDPLAATVNKQLEILWAALARPTAWSLDAATDFYYPVQKS